MKKFNLSELLDYKKLNQGLISQISDELKKQAVLSMAIIDLEDDNAILCDHPIDLLHDNLSETTVSLMSISDLVNHVSQELTTGYDRERLKRSCNKTTLNRKLNETNIYSFIVRKHGANNRLKVEKFNFAPLDDAHNLILWNRREITSTLEYDILTGGRNRIGLFHLILDMIEGCKDPNEFSIVFFNIQSFYHINELYGMAAGDAIIQHFYTSLGYSELSPLAYGRTESDHFYALVHRENVTAENLSKLNRLEAKFKGKKIPYHTLCGIYHLTDLNESPASMCGRASIAANYVKDPYLEPWKVFDDVMRRRYLIDSEVVDRLEYALENNEFIPYYQPIVNARTGRVEMAEALARWKSTNFGFVSPADFIPSLEKHGGISRVDTHISNKVIEMLRSRLHANKHVVPIDVNVSWADFNDADFVKSLVSHLEDTEVSTDLCRYEITESTIAEMTESRHELLDIFKEHNAKLLIDDFGKGYSFSTMRDVDFYIAKLDKSLIDKLGSSQKTDILVDSLIGIFHKMGAKVVAEGVEKLHQVEYLQRVGCDYIQGFYFYRPMPEDQFIELLDKETEAEELQAVDSIEQIWVEREVLEAQYEAMKKTNEESKCLKMLLGNENIHYFEWDVKTHIDVCSDSFKELYNIPSNEIHNMPENAGLCYPEDVDRFREFYYRAERGERMGTDYFRLFSPDGNGYIWFRKTFYTIFDKDNKPYKVILTMQDCTDKYKHGALVKRNDLLVHQQEIVTFCYTVANDLFEFTYLLPDGTVKTESIKEYLSTPDTPELRRDQRLLAAELREKIADVNTQAGFIDFWDDRFGMEMRAHYSKVESEFGNLYAIVGQAENINRTREKLQETIATQKSLISMTEGLSKIYNAVTTINLVDYSSKILLLDQSYNSELSKDMDWDTVAQKYVNSLLKPKYRKAFLDFMRTSTLAKRLKGKRYISLEYEDTTFGWIRGFLLPSGHDDKGIITSALFASLPISSEKETIDRLVYLSETDSLTGIRNRYSGEALVENALKNHKHGIFAIIDCDNFKQVNDTFGHLVGDRYLYAVATCLKESNTDGITMRLGGDEFAMFLFGHYDYFELKNFFDKIFRKIEQLEIEGLDGLPKSVSVGAARYFGEDNTDFDALYRIADNLLYMSKKTHGCQLSF